jgi:hypothetical protein
VAPLRALLYPISGKVGSEGARILAIEEISTRGKKLLAKQQGIIGIKKEKYRLRRQEAIDWVTEGFEQLSELDKDEAAMFGSPQEANALDDYPNLNSVRIPMAPLIDFLKERLKRLKQMRRDLSMKSTAETPGRPLVFRLKTKLGEHIPALFVTIVGGIIIGLIAKYFL